MDHKTLACYINKSFTLELLVETLENFGIDILKMGENEGEQQILEMYGRSQLISICTGLIRLNN